MALTLQIIASIFSLSAVSLQPITTNYVQIYIKDIGVGTFNSLHERSIREIANLIRTKEYEEAINRIQTDRLNFFHKYVWLQGFCYLESGDLKNATRDLTLAKGRDLPNEYLIETISVEVFLCTETHKQEAYKRMKKLRHVELRLLGNRLCSRKLFEEAQQCYSEAFLQLMKVSSIPPGECYISRGYCYVKMEEFDLSLADFKQAKLSIMKERVTDHGDGEIQVLFTHALFDAGFFDKAMEHMTDLKSEMDVVSVIEKILYKDIYRDEGLRFCSAAIKKYPKNAILYEKRGQQHRRMKQYEEAMEDFRKATTMKSSLVDSWMNLIDSLRITGDFAEARQVLKDFDKLALPMKNLDITELEEIRLKTLRKEKEDKVDERWNY